MGITELFRKHRSEKWKEQKEKVKKKVQRQVSGGEHFAEIEKKNGEKKTSAPINSDTSVAFSDEHLNYFEKIQSITTMYPAHLFIFESDSKIKVFVTLNESLRVIEKIRYCTISSHGIYDNDKKRLRKFLKNDLKIDWADDAEITRFDDSKTIRIVRDGNLAEIKINDDKAALIISDKKIHDLNVKNVNGELLRLSFSNNKKHHQKNDLATMAEYSKDKEINTLECSKTFENLLRSVEQNNEEEVIKTGIVLHKDVIPNEIETLLKKELRKDNDKIKKILIFCEDEAIDYIWEWLHLGPSSIMDDAQVDRIGDKNRRISLKKENKVILTNGKPHKLLVKAENKKPNIYEKGFFWGDKFNVIRIPENCDFEHSTFQINDVGFLGDENCKVQARNDYFYLNSKGVSPIKITSDNSKELNKHDCIHVVANAEANTESGDIEAIILSALAAASAAKKVPDVHEENIKKFLFLNILTLGNSYSKCNLQSELMRLIPAKTCIYTSLNVSKNIASKFTDCFFASIDGEKNLAEIATEARSKINNLKDLDSSEKFWRFAYVVEGNPCINITLG